MSANPGPISTLPEEIRRIIVERLGYGHFFVEPPAGIELEFWPHEELTWEIYHGRLLDAAQTRRQQSFESWNLYWIQDKRLSDQPILSVKFDTERYCLHVTRGIECYAWEAYDDGSNVILTREVRKWARELVATLDLRAYSNLEHLREDLGFRLFQAVIGTSRLPLTSLEAPLPGFTLGKLAYFPSMTGQGHALKLVGLNIEYALVNAQTTLEKVKAFEFVLRGSSPKELLALPARFAKRPPEAGVDVNQLPGFILSVFDEVSLSPYTHFVERMLGFLRDLDERGPLISPAQRADILSTILRRLGRHLTAFDLVTFHHRGANYPDLLMLDAVLKELLALAERWPDLFAPLTSKTKEQARACWLRLRGLRQGYFFRRRYEGHLVPDVPTSHGENMRVLPPSFRHLSEEQILDPSARQRRLFADDDIDSHVYPNANSALAASFQLLDLEPAELQELGTALVLDRPLGIFKHPTEPDQTLLLSYVAFSRTIAERRFREMHDLGMFDDEQFTKAQAKLAALKIDGIPIPKRSVPPRPGVPSLEDALKVAPDFVLLRTTRRTVNDFLTQYDVNAVRHRFPLELLPDTQRVVIVGGEGQGPASLMIHTAALRLEFAFDPKAGHVVHRCHEYPVGGLQLVRVWEPHMETGAMIPRDMRAENIRIGPRD